jgi:2-C-methyl-D-erythritol 2,4-cyclodiphosphate synthase
VIRQRLGLGYDSHAFGAKRPLVLGGVTIKHTSGLKGHSDGDAVAHALMDALLGAAAMGDIGRLFPDTDPRWKNADSMQLLADVRHRLVAAGYSIVNLDVTVITEAPRLAPHVDAMRERLAAVLGVAAPAVSVKAKTNEGLDDVGKGKGLQVFAIASIAGA